MRFIQNKKFQAYFVFILSMSFLSGIHIYRMIIDYGNWTLDVNVILMINVCKISAIAFSYYDSDRDEKKCTDYMLRHKLDRVPNILEYFSYIYFIPSCIVGPFF